MPSAPKDGYRCTTDIGLHNPCVTLGARSLTQDHRSPVERSPLKGQKFLVVRIFSSERRQACQWARTAPRPKFRDWGLSTSFAALHRDPTPMPALKYIQVLRLAQASCQKCDHNPGKHLGRQRSKKIN